MNINETRIAGRLTRDPEMKYLPKGTAVAVWAVAVNRKWKTDGGEMKEDVTFVEQKAFGKTAENVQKFFRKGDQIYTEGRIVTESWDDKATGQKRSKTLVLVDSFQFVGSRREGSEPRDVSPQGAYAPKAPEPPKDVADDDVPF